MKFKCHFLNVLVIVVTPLFSLGAPNSLTYQGRILSSEGRPLEYNNVSFLFEITSNNGTCIIYREQKNAIDMTNSQGVFDVPIGTGNKLFPSSPTKSLLSVFDNTKTHDCADPNNNVAGTYTPASGHTRLLRVQFHDGTGWRVISPDNEIRTVPFSAFAHSAEKLGENFPSDFVLKIGVPTCGGSEFLSWNGSAFTCAPVTGASGGTVTTVSSTNSYLSIANASSTPQLTLNVGTSSGTVAAGDDARFSSAHTISAFNSAVGSANCAADETPYWSSVAGKFLCQPINIATTKITGTLPINNGGTGQTTALAAFNALSPLTSKGDLLTRDGTNTVRLPVGIDGQVLSSNSSQTSGLQWVTPTNGTVTSVSGTTPIVVASGTTTPIISINDATTSSKGAVQIGAGIAVSSGTISADPANFPTSIPISKGGTGATSFTANRLIASSGTGALTAFSCANGQMVSFDASGMMTCTSFTNNSLFLNGGNSFTAAATLGTNDAFDLNFETSNVTRMTIGSTGNIAINTTIDPNARLAIKAGSTSQAPLILDSPASGIPSIDFLRNGTWKGTFGYASGATNELFISNGVAGPIIFDTSNVEKMRVDTNGSVGIGTSSPLVKLHVASEADMALDGTTPFLVTRSTSYPTSGTETAGIAYLSESSASSTTLWPPQANVSFSPTENHSATNKGTAIGFSTTPNGATARQQRMIINHDGNVGIGVTTPGQKLTVGGTIESTSGGIKFPDGTTQSTAATGMSIQKGQIGNCTNNSTGTTGSVTFPTAFPGAPIVQLTVVELDNSGCTSARLLAISATGFSWTSYVGGALTACDCIYWTAFY